MSLDAARHEARPERLTAHEIRQRLQHERNSRITQLNAIDEAGHEAADDLMAAQRTSIQRVLKEIDTAFQRLDEGSYGTCQDCAKPIPVERLEILPYARCCVGCRQRPA
ncbi:TraR/DksA family transcriptional regulator [Streptomyces sp. NPDC059909]|uniref:TraR/DksA family transcriptional regulator n=1 Tax=Streptomyces sp. NPDC059909 TaxID=3346998 RepID=UPI003653C209